MYGSPKVTRLKRAIAQDPKWRATGAWVVDGLCLGGDAPQACHRPGPEVVNDWCLGCSWSVVFIA